MTAPHTPITSSVYLQLQQNILAQGLDFSHVERKDDRIDVIRQGMAPLSISVIGMQAPPIGQLLILSPEPNRPFEAVVSDAEAAVGAFESTWPASVRQIVNCDATLRALYESDGDHAFRELWEGRLNQSADTLMSLGRPVLGGGVRFVMPPLPDEPEPVIIELKIESFLENSKMVFIEVQFRWTTPETGEHPFRLRERLNRVERYLTDQATAFLFGGRHA